MSRHSESPSTALAAAQLAFRVGLGVALAAHGTQKLFGWFGGGGLKGTGGFFESVGFRPGHPHALAAGLAEAGGGAALALGLATPAAGAAVAGNMIVASSQHTGKGFFNTAGGYEYPALLGLAGAALALGGAGRFSLDHATGHALDRPWMRAVALIGVPIGAAVVLSRRQSVQAEQATADPSTPGPASDADDSSAQPPVDE